MTSPLQTWVEPCYRAFGGLGVRNLGRPAQLLAVRSRSGVDLVALSPR